MAQVTVAYKDLENTRDNLAPVKENVENMVKQVDTIIKQVQELGAKHDNCFGKTLDSLDFLKKDFANYAMEIDFLIKQCDAAVQAFSDSEYESIKDSDKLTDKMKNVVKDLLIMTGAAEGTNVDDIGKDSVERAETSSDITADNRTGTIDERSDTWENVFVDEDADSAYDKTNADLSAGAESVTPGDDDKKPGDDNPEDTGDDGSDDDYQFRRDSGGGGNGGHSGGGGGDPYVPEPTPSPSPTPSLTSTITTETTSPTPTDPITPTQTPSVTGETIPSITPTQTVEPTVTPSTTPTVVPTPTPPSGGNTTTVTYHTGGGYSEDEGYVPYEPEYTSEGSGLTENLAEPENTTEGALVEEGLEEGITGEVEDNIVKGDDITVIPTDSEPISYRESKGGGSFIPIAAGLSAAAAAGLGAKAYMDHKKNNSDEDIDEFESDEWSGDESTDIDYGDTSPKEEYLDDDDYVASEEPVTEKYGARNNEELADLQ